jgi:hypothetical protein
LRVERGTEREHLWRAQGSQHIFDAGRHDAAQRARDRRVEFGELEEHRAEAEEEQRGESNKSQTASGGHFLLLQGKTTDIIWLIGLG